MSEENLAKTTDVRGFWSLLCGFNDGIWYINHGNVIPGNKKRGAIYMPYISAATR